MRDVIVALAAGMLFVGTVSAQGSPGGKKESTSQAGRITCDLGYKHGSQDKYVKFKDELALTAEQDARVTALADELMASTERRGAEMKALRVDMAKNLRSPSPDFVAAREKAKTISDLQLQSTTAMLETYEKAYALLTDAQKTKLAELLSRKQSGGKKGKTPHPKKQKGE